MFIRFVLSVSILLCCLPSPSLGKDPKPADSADKSDPGKGVNFYSIEQEMALGKQMADETERQAEILTDPVINEYVNRLGQNLVRNSDAKVPFHIKVINCNEVNAFALPGGFLYVNTGLILKTEGEAELAGVMAHEIAHVAARHGTKQATRGTIMNYATIPLIFLGGGIGVAVREAATLAVPLGFLQFSRSMEREADRLGLQYMYRTGYDPNAFLDFFERIEALEKKKPGTISKLFSSHPTNGARLLGAQREIQISLKSQAEYVVDTSEFHEIRQHLQNANNRRAGENRNSRTPVLVRRTEGSVGTTASSDSDDDQRPTLKRRN